MIIEEWLRTIANDETVNETQLREALRLAARALAQQQGVIVRHKEENESFARYIVVLAGLLLVTLGAAGAYFFVRGG